MSLANTPTSLLFSNWQRLAITRVSLVPKVRFQQGSKLRLADRRQAAAAALQGREQCARVETQKDRLGNFALNKSNQVVESVRGRACCQSSLVVWSATWQPLLSGLAGAGITPQAKGRQAVRCEQRRGSMAKQLLRVRAALRSVHVLACVLGRATLTPRSPGAQGVKTEGLRLRLVDAKEKVVGRLAAHIAMLLQARCGPASSPRPSAAARPSTPRCCKIGLYG